ncbi:hypothetical protein NBRC3255_2424 [Gluconobacter thailandicus NBRC 3255]|nr:hypothetical protein NBRC3255_2424 [Gluconobacter thailandicus NBRC 3255]
MEQLRNPSESVPHEEILAHTPAAFAAITSYRSAQDLGHDAGGTGRLHWPEHQLSPTLERTDISASVTILEKIA